MKKQCSICGKGSKIFGRRIKLRGKYNPTTKKRKYPNLQWVKIPLEIKKEPFKNFAGKRILICTNCLKTMEKREKIK